MVLYNPCRCLERLPQKSKHEFSQVLIINMAGKVLKEYARLAEVEAGHIVR
jgi:hypothetical protein